MGQTLRNLARRWAGSTLVPKLSAAVVNRLIEEAEDLRYKLIRANAAKERLTQERDRVRGWYVKAHTRVDELLAQVTDLAGENAELAGENRDLKQAVDAAREAERQAQAGRAVAEQDAAAAAEKTARLRREIAEANATIEGLGQANTELEKALERKQFLDEDDKHRRLMDGERD